MSARSAAVAEALAGRSALVTGCSHRSGIGFAVARRLLELGAAVTVHTWPPYDEGGIEPLLAELGRVGHVAADFADPEAPAQVVAAARGDVGHLDIVVANHALGEKGRLGETSAAQLDAHFQVNVRGSVLLAQQLAAQHDGRRGGRVILMTSGQHLGGMPEELAYAISKGALWEATRSLSDELVGRGITVNTINPGPTDTGYLAGVDPIPDMPLGRWGRPEDAARLIGWLCTDEAAWVSGQVINSEGGFRR
jgi:3-oxoacyl-[acyl-carrier protein] reductase